MDKLKPHDIDVNELIATAIDESTSNMDAIAAVTHTQNDIMQQIIDKQNEIIKHINESTKPIMGFKE